MSWVHRTMIVAAPAAPFARALAAAFPSSAGMWTTGMSASGTEPATHFVSSGLLQEEFATLLPLTAWTRSEAGDWVRGEHTPGQPAVIVAAAAQAGVTVSEDQVLALFAACDVTEQSFDDAAQRMGLRLVSESQEL